MTLLLVRNSKSSYSLFSPDTYGTDTWGMNSQRDLVKKRKHWYTTYWCGGNDYIDDYSEEDKVNVVLETKDIDEIVKYLYNKKVKGITAILDEYAEIVKDYISIEKWILGGKR